MSKKLRKRTKSYSSERVVVTRGYLQRLKTAKKSRRSKAKKSSKKRRR